MKNVHALILLKLKLQASENRYELVSSESLSLDKMRRHLSIEVDEAKDETREKINALKKAEDRIDFLEVQVSRFLNYFSQTL